MSEYSLPYATEPMTSVRPTCPAVTAAFARSNTRWLPAPPVNRCTIDPSMTGASAVQSHASPAMSPRPTTTGKAHARRRETARWS